jgi:hypothetical protein
MNEQQPTKEMLYRFYLPVATIVISSKGGIPKIWGETLLLLLLGIHLLCRYFGLKLNYVDDV